MCVCWRVLLLMWLDVYEVDQELRGLELSLFVCLGAGDLCKLIWFCERFEPRCHFKSRLSLIVRVNVVLNRTVVVDSD